MQVDVCETIWIRRTREEVFDFTNAVENMTSFVGFGPIPGIVSARWLEGGGPAPGARREVTKSDGTTHLEEMVTYEPPGRHCARITGLAAPFAWLVREIRDDFWLVADAGGTRVDRIFRAELTVPLAWPAVMLLRPLLREAVRRDLRGVKRRMEA